MELVDAGASNLWGLTKGMLCGKKIGEVKEIHDGGMKR